MRPDPAYRKITADEFLRMDFGSDRRFELADGVVVAMTGGSVAHALVQSNVQAWLRQRLRGTGCRVFGPDMAIRVSDTEVRYPDVSIHCARGPIDELLDRRVLDDPLVLIEILSPSTATHDQGTKLEEYRRIDSVRTIAFVDPVARLCRTVERLPGEGWLDQLFSATAGVAVPSLGLTIPPNDVFARD